MEDYIAALESNLEEIDRMSRIVEDYYFFCREPIWAKSKQSVNRFDSTFCWKIFSAKPDSSTRSGG